MDCLEAQQVLSEAVDHEPVDPELLAQARIHCLACADCARFVRGLALLQRAEPPKASPALSTRVLEALERERAASRVESPAAAAVAVPAPTPRAPAGANRRRMRPRSVIAWAGAAAAVLIVAAFAANAGLHTIIRPNAPSLGSVSAPRQSAAGKGSGTSATDGLSAMVPNKSTESTARAASKTSEDYITVSGVAYRFAGADSIPRSELTVLGTTTTALGTGRAPQVLTVYATPTKGRVAVIADGATLAFDVVSRLLGGRTYVLTCDSIPAFGTWPSLPSQFIQPTTADGAPTFVAAQSDDLGVQVFARPGTPVSDAFAIAPGTPESDPAHGDPNWTWWTLSNR